MREVIKRIAYVVAFIVAAAYTARWFAHIGDEEYHRPKPQVIYIYR